MFPPFAWEGGCVGIGADPRNDIVWPGAGSEPFHAGLYPLEGGAWRVRDLGSAAGLLVNGRRVHAAILADGDRLELPGASLAFSLTAAPADGPRQRMEEKDDRVALADGVELRELASATAAASGTLLESLLALAVDGDSERLLGAAVAALGRAAAPSFAFAGLFEGEAIVDVRATAGREARGARLRASRRLIERARRQNRPLLARRAADLPGTRSASMEGFGIVTALVVPLAGARGVAGVLYADWREDRGEPAPAELDAACALALFAAARFEARPPGVLRRATADLPRRTEPIGISAGIRKLVARLDALARTNASVLITGATGTGKTFLAERLHVHSARSARPFVAVNCAAIAESLFESELFGHEAGAFTGAHEARDGLFRRADGGTLFLDELAEASPAQQAKLLHVLQSGVFRRVGGNTEERADVRVLAGTNRDVADESLMRLDLLHRFDISGLRVPPLGERREDVPFLAYHFLDREAAAVSRTLVAFEPEVMEAMLEHDWPGNVRELEKAVRAAVLLADPGHATLALEDFALSAFAQARARGVGPAPAADAGGRAGTSAEPARSLAEAEREHLARTLAQTGGNQRRACEILGISPNTMTKKKRLYGL